MKFRNWGIPYMGSKSKICDALCKIFPKADNFYDLFGGGFSVTHWMMVNRGSHYKHFHYNEIRPGVVKLVEDAIAGNYNYDVFKPQWVSREEFFLRKEEDAYIKICWSFGNNGKNYLFGKDIESYKRSMHNAVVFNEFDAKAREVFGMESFRDVSTITERRLFLRDRCRVLYPDKGPTRLQHLEQLQQLQQLLQLERLQQLEQLERLLQLQQLQQLERLLQLQQLQQLERLQQFTTSSLSYEQVAIGPNSVIYCDIPYRGTVEYDGGFDHDAFYDWAATHSEPVFISEYNVPDKRLVPVWQIAKRSNLSATKLKDGKQIIAQEKLYANTSAIEILNNEWNS